ncbi:MAG: hypothetical protein JJT75_01130 [Opitutales bacterium]|nr:hypothetical protein [Opitutales bacterium]
MAAVPYALTAEVAELAESVAEGTISFDQMDPETALWSQDSTTGTFGYFVQNQGVRITPSDASSSNRSPMISMGHENNEASAAGATVSGGGNEESPNTASDSYATVGGGEDNTASYFFATVGGGMSNEVGGNNATVGGGMGNIAQGSSSTVPGGVFNEALGDFSFAAGVATAGDTTLESGFWTGRLEVIVEYDNAFEEWMANLDPEDKPPEGQQGPDDTPAGDGVSNLLKFAFGLMPLEPSADAMPTLLIDNEEDFLGLSFIRSTDAEVTLKIYGSEDLDEWEEISHAEGVIEENLPGNREKVHLLTGLQTEDHDRYFFRLHVEVE